MKQLLTAILLTTLLVSAAAQARLYRWVDDEGNVRFSDRVPPEHARHGHEVKARDGTTIERRDRAKTREELEAERRERERLEAERKAAEAAAAKKAERDRILLLTYSSVADIDRARDDRLAAVESRIALARNRIESIEREIEDQQRRAADAERSGRAPQAMHERIQYLNQQIARHEARIQEEQQERDAIAAAFAEDRERYETLRRERSQR